jgi:hypothetical protein
LSTSGSNTNKKYVPKEKKDDSPLSKNHSRSLKFRLRVQTEKEAEVEIDEFTKKNNDGLKRVY